MLYQLFKPVAFSLDAEFVHDQTISFLSKHGHWGHFLGIDKGPNDKSLQVGSINWSFPVGLAAGLDKNAQCFDFFSGLGFGAVEVGTVTPKPQVGNPKPRLFRYPNEESLRNCMGFNNHGADFMMETVSRIRERQAPLGINIGKNKITDDSDAHLDYAYLYEKFKSDADYIVVNVSSPNTPGLREHQSRDGLESILSNIGRKNGDVDLYVKISPDMNEDSIYDVVEVANKYNVTGIIGTNTTIMEERGVGGVSGKLLFEKSKRMRTKCLDAVKDSNLEFIGVGGFSSFDQIVDYWKCGGSALQIYSSFIFQGPQILKDINEGIDNLMAIHRVSNMDDLMKSLREN
jgi:dihydroorotate dehydrogenase